MKVPANMHISGHDIPVWRDWFTGIMYGNVARYLQNKQIKTCVDVGAAVGIASRFLLHHLQPDSLLCFEPDAENYTKLQYNLKDYKNIILVNKAIFYGKSIVNVSGIGDNSNLGYMVADIDPEHYEYWTQLTPYENKTFVCTTLEEHTDPVDLMKIDVEGSEYNIIEHSELIRECRFLLLETHNHNRAYVEAYIAQHLPHKIVFTQGDGIHLGFLLEL